MPGAGRSRSQPSARLVATPAPHHHPLRCHSPAHRGTSAEGTEHRMCAVRSPRHDGATRRHAASNHSPQWNPPAITREGWRGAGCRGKGPQEPQQSPYDLIIQIRNASMAMAQASPGHSGSGIVVVTKPTSPGYCSKTLGGFSRTTTSN